MEAYKHKLVICQKQGHIAFHLVCHLQLLLFDCKKGFKKMLFIK